MSAAVTGNQLETSEAIGYHATTETDHTMPLLRETDGRGMATTVVTGARGDVADYVQGQRVQYADVHVFGAELPACGFNSVRAM